MRVRRLLGHGLERLEDRRLLAGFAVTESSEFTIVSEAGTIDPIAIVLTAQPDSDVVLLLTSGDTSEVTVHPASLTFTPENWNWPRMVSVNGVDDLLVDGSQVTQVTVSVDPDNSDDAFDLLPSQSVEVITTDNEVPGFTVSRNTAMVSESGTSDNFAAVLAAQPDADVVLTVTSADTEEVTVVPPTLTFTPADWNLPQTVTITGVDDDVDDGIQMTGVTVSVDDAVSDPLFAALSDEVVEVFTTDDDVVGFTLSEATALVSENGTTDTFTAHLTAPPESNVVLTVASSDPGEAAVSPTTLTFTPSDWNSPQTVTITGVDDLTIDGSQISLVTVGVDDGASDDGFDGLSDQTVIAITTDDDDAGFVLSTILASVSESGTTDAFTIRLTAQPSTDVTLTVISSDTGEVTASPTVLVFAPADWNSPQTVTVTGVDDPLIDGSQITLVTVRVAGEVSDGDFAELAEQTVIVTTADDDVAGFTLSKTAVSVSESGTSDTFTVVLTAQPGSNVVLDVTSGDTGEATAGPATLTFTPEDWNSPQTVTVTGVDDVDDDGDQSTSVTVGVDKINSDGQFVGVGSQAVSVTTADNDVSWRNTENPFDVDGNGWVDAADVLMIINYLNGHSEDLTLPPSPAAPPPYYDVNGDGLCTAADVLVVINYINTYGLPHTSGGEGEDASRGRLPDAAVGAVAPTEPTRLASANESLAPASSDATARAPRSALARPPGDQRMSGTRTRLAHLVSGGRRQAADAVFEAWPDSPADDLTDTLAPDLGCVLRRA